MRHLFSALAQYYCEEVPHKIELGKQKQRKQYIIIQEQKLTAFMESGKDLGKSSKQPKAEITNNQLAF